ncbi:hypothetical protein ES703_67372 [subsurface metagenome]
MIDVDHDDTITRILILFVQTAHAVLKYADAHFYRKARLSVIKHMLLEVLAANGGTMTPSEIAESTLRERHNITTLVDRLRQEGLVRTERNEKDKRSVNIILTGSGREVLSQSTPVAREIVDQVMLSISAGDAVLLEKPLRVLRQNACNGLEYLAKRSHPQPG